MRRLEGVFLGIGFVFLLSEVFGGMLRYYLASLGVAPLIYLPKALLAVGLAGAVLLSLVNKRVSLFFLLVLALAVEFSLVGYAFVGNSLQVTFGLWVILPFFYGVLILPSILRVWSRLRPYLLLLWGSAVIGVIINAFHDWPWVGFAYSLGGVEVEGSRAWFTAGLGLFRIPGFSRASFEAASQILLLGLSLTFLMRMRWRVLLWLVSGVAIVLTTSKTPLGIWLFLSLMFVLGRLVPLRFLRLLPVFFALAGIGLPLSSVYVSYDPKADSAVERFLVASFADRLGWMWPMSLQMVVEHGSWLFGRGIGGIGSPQQYFEPLLYSPADNLAVYLFGLGGVVGLLLLAAYGLIASLIPLRTLQDRFFFLLTLAVLLEGWTVNVMESSFFGMAFGLTLRYWWEMSEKRAVSPKEGARSMIWQK
ncbi:hypothetical protein [Thermus sp. FJN-A]